ncbi:MAG: hypothetical protein ACLFVQ_00775 [Chitinispirillaceae bacterium]
MLFKKIRGAAFFAILSISFIHAAEVGIPFGFGGSPFGLGGSQYVGVRIHVTDFYAVQPSVQMSLTENDNNLGLHVDNLFYLTEMNSLEQYAGFNVAFNLDDDFRLGGFYGLQHSINQSVDVYGQIGLGIDLDPAVVYTANTGLGVIFYIQR